MAMQQSVRLLSRILIYSAQVLVEVREENLRRMLSEALDDFLRAALDGDGDGGPVHESAGVLSACLEDIGIAGAAPGSPLLLPERHVLLLQLHLQAHPAPDTRASSRPARRYEPAAPAVVPV